MSGNIAQMSEYIAKTSSSLLGQGKMTTCVRIRGSTDHPDTRHSLSYPVLAWMDHSAVTACEPCIAQGDLRQSWQYFRPHGVTVLWSASHASTR